MNYKIAAILATAFLILAACEKEGPMEQAGEDIDNAVEDVKDAANEVADEIEEGADEVADKVDDAG